MLSLAKHLSRACCR